MNHIYRSAVFIITAATLLATQGCGHKEEKESKEKTAQTVPATEAFRLQKNNLSSSIKIPGELIAFQQVDMYAKVTGYIKKLYVDIGSEVQSGQLLATLEAPEMNAQIAGASSRIKSQEAIYLSSKATYDRLLQTSKTPGTVSQNDLDVANARQKSDAAQLEAVKASQREVTANNDYLQMRAQFSGVITARNVSAGAYVGPSGRGSEMPVFTLQEQKRLRLVVSIPDAYVNSLRHQSEVEFTVKSMPNEKFKAKVTRLSGALDNKLRAERVEMDVQNNNHELLPGMVAEVSLVLSGNDNVFVVPSSAVLNSTEGVFVVKVEQGKAIWVPVTTGRSDDDKTEVYGTLTENDVLVKTANEEIRDGAPLKQVVVK